MKSSSIASDNLFKALLEVEAKITFHGDQIIGRPGIDTTKDEVFISNVDIEKIPFTGYLTSIDEPEPPCPEETDKPPDVRIIPGDCLYRPFSLIYNNQFFNPQRNPLGPNKKFYNYINTLKQHVIEEINNNINLRLGKWDILDYLNIIKFKLEEIRSTYQESDERLYWQQYDKIYKRTIELRLSGDVSKRGYLDININYALSRFWEMEITVIDELLRFISIRLPVVETANDYVKEVSAIPNIGATLIWTKSNTDLLELIVALLESGAIQNPTKNLTQKDTIAFISQVFQLEIKDPYKKLNAARMRKREEDNFLDRLSKALNSYYEKQDEKQLK